MFGFGQFIIIRTSFFFVLPINPCAFRPARKTQSSLLVRLDSETGLLFPPFPESERIESVQKRAARRKCMILCSRRHPVLMVCNVQQPLHGRSRSGGYFGVRYASAVDHRI